MAKKTETVTIDEDTYQITQLGWETGQDLYVDLIKAVGPTITSKLANLKEYDEEAGQTAIVGLIIEVIGALPKDLVRTLSKEFSQASKRKAESTGDGEAWLPLSATYDDHFAGRPRSWTQWMIACLKLNFLSFLGSEASK